jgi:DNA-binding winged helix-turn-helix (wHTH) protein
MLYAFGDCELDAARCELRRAGETVPVEPRVFKVLAYFLAYCDWVVTKGELLECFWPDESRNARCISIYRTVRLGTGVARRCGVVKRATSTPASNPNK